MLERAGQIFGRLIIGALLVGFAWVVAPGILAAFNCQGCITVWLSDLANVDVQSQTYRGLSSGLIEGHGTSIRTLYLSILGIMQLGFVISLFYFGYQAGKALQEANRAAARFMRRMGGCVVVLVKYAALELFQAVMVQDIWRVLTYVWSQV